MGAGGSNLLRFPFIVSESWKVQVAIQKLPSLARKAFPVKERRVICTIRLPTTISTILKTRFKVVSILTHHHSLRAKIMSYRAVRPKRTDGIFGPFAPIVTMPVGHKSRVFRAGVGASVSPDGSWGGRHQPLTTILEQTAKEMSRYSRALYPKEFRTVQSVPYEHTA